MLSTAGVMRGKLAFYAENDHDQYATRTGANPWYAETPNLT
jgi:hypothetical protein